jgi:hypothetical protein
MNVWTEQQLCDRGIEVLGIMYSAKKLSAPYSRVRRTEYASQRLDAKNAGSPLLPLGKPRQIADLQSTEG